MIGGMRNMLGPALGALFFILFRELFSIWTPNWLLWFGLIFIAFVLYSPGGLVGIWGTLQRRFWPLPDEAAAMSKRKIYDGLPHGLCTTHADIVNADILKFISA